jgi:serine/threonine-protein kinase
MGLLKGLKANKAIAVLLDEGESQSSEIKQATASLKQMGSKAVPKLIDALEENPSNSTILNLLGSMLDNESLHHYADSLAHHNKRIVTTVTQMLAQSPLYDVNRLYELFDDPDIPKNVLVQILVARRNQLNIQMLLSLLADGSKPVKQMAFRVLEHVANESIVPDLLPLVDNPDPKTRAQLIKVLAKMKGSTAVRDALFKMLSDKEKYVRQAAVDGLGNLTVPVPVKPLVQLLKDPDITTQSKTIEALTKIRDPETIKYLIDILQDDSEYVRRAAVEVLNEIGDHRAIKELLNALRDKDWWIRVRAADAMGSIGGPKVIDAVLMLIKDDDEFLRRTAVEILNNIKDERAFDHLVAALADTDWWVRERAADALSSMGDQRAIPALLKMVVDFPDSEKVGIDCLQQLGDPESLHSIIEQLDDLDPRAKTSLIAKVAADVSATPVRGTSFENEPTRLIGGGAESAAPASGEKWGRRAMDATQIRNPQEPVAKDETEKAPSPTSIPTAGVIDPSELEPGETIAGRYTMIRKVGEGAFGIVLLMHDEVVNEDIILKFLNPHVASDEHIIKRFIQELRYSRKITHENVIRIFDFLTIGKSSAISMEYFDSHSLAYEIKSKKTTNQSRMLKVLIEVCNGLSFAHRAGVIHRDIKPANILINEQDVVKLVDFGLAAAAKNTDSRLTRSGVLVGTPTYMAPEQVRDKTIDARTDIYSLGVLMYEIFTGRPPYRGKDSMAILFQHVEGKAAPPKTINSEISDELNDLIMKAMAVNPNKRFQTVDELRSNLVKLALKVND